MTNSQPARMTLADLLDSAGQLYLNNAALFLTTIAVVAVPGMILSFAFGQAGATLSGLLSFIGTGALIQAAAARIRGQSPSVAEVYAAVGVSGFVLLLVTEILYALAVVLGLILLIIPGIYLLVRWLFVSQAIVADKTGISEAFSTSSNLVQGQWWRVAGYGIVLFLLVTLVEAAVQQISGVGSVLSFLIEILIRPFSVAALTLLYFELKREKAAGPTGPVSARWGA